MIPRDYATRTVDAARAHAAQFAEPEPAELLGGAEPESEQHKEDADELD